MISGKSLSPFRLTSFSLASGSSSGVVVVVGFFFERPFHKSAMQILHWSSRVELPLKEEELGCKIMWQLEHGLKDPSRLQKRDKKRESWRKEKVKVLRFLQELGILWLGWDNCKNALIASCSFLAEAQKSESIFLAFNVGLFPIVSSVVDKQV